jgi:hypothetical protein
MLNKSLRLIISSNWFEIPHLGVVIAAVSSDYFENIQVVTVQVGSQVAASQCRQVYW